MSSPEPSIYGLVHGEPFSPTTYSGTSPFLFGELQRRSLLVGAGNAQLDALEELTTRALSFSPSIARWREKYNLSRTRAFWQQRTARRLVKGSNADTVLQIGSWYRTERSHPQQMVVPYLDSCFTVWLERPEVHIRPTSRFARWRRAHEQAIYDDANLVFTMSAFLRERVVDDFGLDPSKVVNVGAAPNIAVPQSVPDRSDNTPVFLFVGKKFERKGGPAVLDAFRTVRARFPNAELWIVGPEGLSVDQPGVVVHGRISDATRLREMYERASVFVMPSVFEPFGIVYLEAMAYGLPVIATAGGPRDEIVDDGKSGYLVDQGDVPALAERMVELSDSPIAAKMGAAGRTRIDEYYRWDQVVERMTSAITGSRTNRLLSGP